MMKTARLFLVCLPILRQTSELFISTAERINQIEFRPYESSFSVSSSQIQYQGGTHVITNQMVSIYSEGEEYKTLVNAILILNDDNTKLNVAYSLDEGPFYSYELDCQTQSVDIGE